MDQGISCGVSPLQTTGDTFLNWKRADVYLLDIPTLCSMVRVYCFWATWFTLTVKIVSSPLFHQFFLPLLFHRPHHCLPSLCHQGPPFLQNPSPHLLEGVVCEYIMYVLWCLSLSNCCLLGHKTVFYIPCGVAVGEEGSIDRFPSTLTVARCKSSSMHSVHWLWAVSNIEIFCLNFFFNFFKFLPCIISWFLCRSSIVQTGRLSCFTKSAKYF